MSEIAIRLTDVSKRFKLYNNPITGPINEILFFWKRQKYYQEFKAVKDVSLEIKKGEVVGIIGPNGAGKTTLLKMIAGLLPVDGGKLEVNGKITALLALGVGINPEFTGRETIFYNGLLLGMTKEEVLRKMPQIIEFAELGDFIERPIRIYSSGMKARLLFAISMSIDPDILIVDEALATGDSYFVQKSSQRIRELCKSGATILFVSHNLSQIQQLCNRVYFMAEGSILSDGGIFKVVNQYERWVLEKNKSKVLEKQNKIFYSLSGGGEIDLINCYISDPEGNMETVFFTGAPFILNLDYIRNDPKVEECHMFVGIINQSTGQWVGEINTPWYIHSTNGVVGGAIQLTNKGTIRIKMQNMLMTGHYFFWIILYDKNDAYRKYCEYKGIAAFYSNKGSSILCPEGPIMTLPITIEHIDR